MVLVHSRFLSRRKLQKKAMARRIPTCKGRYLKANLVIVIGEQMKEDKKNNSGYFTPSYSIRNLCAWLKLIK